MLINFTVIISVGNTRIFLSQTTMDTIVLQSICGNENNHTVASDVFHSMRCINISARMRAHYNSATCNAKPLCLSAIVNVFAGPFCFFFSR